MTTTRTIPAPGRRRFFPSLLLGALLGAPAGAWAQPVITSPPTSQAVVTGGSVTFSVDASGPGPFSYQWRQNGTNLPGIITTVAGNGTAGYSGDGGPATSARLNAPQGVAVDTAGNLYIGDFQNNRIRKVDAHGIITTIAGTGVQGYSGDGGPATSAKLTYPHGVALDGSGNLYFGDIGNYRIRKVDTIGIITTVAGTGAGGFSGDGGLASKARINWAQGVVLDDVGNLFFADGQNNRIRKIGTDGIITTVAGKGPNGDTGRYSGDGGTATNAGLAAPNGVALDRFGNLFLSGRDRIRKVDPNGIITTVAGGGMAGSIPLFRDGILATNAPALPDKGVAVDGLGNVFFSDSGYNRVRKVDPNGIITTVAGKIVNAVPPFGGPSPGYSGDGGASTQALLNYPGFLALDGSGNLLIGDINNHRVRKVTYATQPMAVLNNVNAQNAGNYDVVVTSPSGSVTSSVAVLTVFLPPQITAQPTNHSAPAGAAASFSVSATGTAPLSYQWFFEGTALAGQTHRTLELANVSSAQAGRYTARVTNLYGSVTSRVTWLSVGTPPTIATQPAASQTVPPGGSVRLIAAAAGSGPFMYQWRRNGTDLPTIFAVAGDGSAGNYSGDGGPATQASLNTPGGVAVDALGNLFIGDTHNNRIRKVDTNGIITTVAGNGYTAGNGTGGYSGDGGLAVNARLNFPEGVAVDGLGNLFIADSLNNRIRKVDTQGIITTVAGRAGFGPFADGVVATSAYLSWPRAVAVDPLGNLLVVEAGYNRIRKVGTDRIIKTVAGNGTAGPSGDGGPATEAAISPGAIALDGSGNLFFADDRRVRKVGTNGIITTVAGTGTDGYSGDGLRATDADITWPSGVAVDGLGNVLFTETDRLRKVDTDGILSTVANAGGTGLAVDGSGSLFVLGNPIVKVIPGGPTLELNNAGAQNAGSYDVVVTSPFGSVTSSAVILPVAQPPADIADDFSDGNDDGWTPYDALAGVYADYLPATFTVTDGQYRIKIQKPPTNPYGYVRALPYRADQTYTDFEVSADVVAWDDAAGSWLGVLGRMNQIGAGKTCGYMLWYYPPNKVLSLNILRGEVGSSIAPNVLLPLAPTHKYRFTLTGIGERLTATVVDLAAPDVVLASITGMSAAYASGYSGLLCGSFTGADVTYDNFVARTPSPAPPSLSLTEAPGVEFQKPARYATGPFPHGIEKGDFNRDGSLDLVVANSRGSSVSLFLGHADGSVSKQADYAVGAGPQAPVAARLNADDFLDLVVANASSTNVSVLLGKADGTFSDGVQWTVGSRPASVAVADFNRDGFLDLATANSGSTNVSVLLGKGDGTFQDKVVVVVGKAPLVVRAADLNGDGFLDLVTANSGEDMVGVLLGNGDGTFKSNVSYPVGKGPSSVAIGNFDADGRPDVAVANRSGNSVLVLPGRGDGTLGAPLSTTFVRTPWDLVLADLNKDAHADLVVTTTVVGNVALLIGDGGSGFGSSSSVLSLGDYSTDAVVADFNQDQWPDLALVCQYGDRLEVLLNRGKPASASPAVDLSWPLPADGYVLQATDGLPGPWSTVSTTAVDRPGQRRALGVERTSDAKFFRLQKP